ncbi:MAG: radical SAM protein [Bacteroidales bacterium]|nr:radical SAM protein [Bacteroidales bacterium]
MDCEIILQGVGKRTVVINPPYPVYGPGKAEAETEDVVPDQTDKTDKEQGADLINTSENVSKNGRNDSPAIHDIDYAFDLPYTRLPHPKYKSRGEIPAYTMIRHSVNIHRGCFGGCAFCTISAHQGKQVQSRSEASILKEVEQVVNMPDFKGYLSDLGGPSANMYNMRGKDLALCRRCSRPSCIVPSICQNLRHDLRPLSALFEKVSAHPKIKKCFIGSGIRYDLIVPFLDTNEYGAKDYAETIIRKGVSGRLKVAPEHTEKTVLRTMRKMPFEQFVRFKRFFDEVCHKEGLRQQLIPYFISAHPNCRLQDMQALSKKTRAMGYHLEQVQLFTPTPMTLATEMFYTGLDPHTLQPVFVERDDRRRDEQNRCFFEESRRPADHHAPCANHRPERGNRNGQPSDRLQNHGRRRTR